MRRGAERAHHGDLAAALDDRERERPGHDEQRDEAGDPAHGAEDGHERRTVGTARVTGVGIGRVLAIEHLERRRDARHVPANDDGVDLVRRAGEARRDGSAKKSVGAAGAADTAGDTVGRVARRRHTDALTGREALVEDNLARAVGARPEINRYGVSGALAQPGREAGRR